MNISGVGEMGVGETGVGEMGQIIGETGVGEMGVGETGTSHDKALVGVHKSHALLSRTRLIKVHVVFVGGEKRLYGVLICLIEQIGGLSRSPCKME